MYLLVKSYCVAVQTSYDTILDSNHLTHTEVLVVVLGALVMARKPRCVNDILMPGQDGHSGTCRREKALTRKRSLLAIVSRMYSYRSSIALVPQWPTYNLQANKVGWFNHSSFLLQVTEETLVQLAHAEHASRAEDVGVSRRVLAMLFECLPAVERRSQSKQ